MTVKAKTDAIRKMKERIKKLPDLTTKAMYGAYKKDILSVNTIFKKGIEDNDLGLKQLTEFTTRMKKIKGMKKPDTPLYGKGRQEKTRSYMNMMNVQRLKNGWKLVPSKRKHWSGSMRLDEMFRMHEFGAKIKTKSGKIKQIPPRPALNLAYRRYMSKQLKMRKNLNAQIKLAMVAYIQKADRRRMDELIAWEQLDVSDS